VSLDNIYVLLWWMCSIGSDYISSCALLEMVFYDWIVVVYYYRSTLL
jgi:hypothetical protein